MAVPLTSKRRRNQASIFGGTNAAARLASSERTPPIRYRLAGGSLADGDHETGAWSIDPRTIRTPATPKPRGRSASRAVPHRRHRGRTDRAVRRGRGRGSRPYHPGRFRHVPPTSPPRHAKRAVVGAATVSRVRAAAGPPPVSARVSPSPTHGDWIAGPVATSSGSSGVTDAARRWISSSSSCMNAGTVFPITMTGRSLSRTSSST